MRISDWSSDVCSSDLARKLHQRHQRTAHDLAAPRSAIGGPAPVQRLRHRHLTAALAASLLAASPASAETLYIAAGRLIDGVSDTARTGQCITVEAERIKAVGACGKAPDGATRLDWSAFTVLPDRK